jgi:diguanylate cyclase (GGDEF)-like protein/PAS domain S-box-containing protein
MVKEPNMPAVDPEVYRAVLENLAIGVYLVDRERRIFLWNDGAENITGRLRQDVLGRACHDDLLMHCDANHTVLCHGGCPLVETMRDGKVREADVFLLHKDGQRVPVHLQVTPIRDAAGGIVGAAESFQERVLLPDLYVHPNERAVHDSVDPLTGISDRHSLLSHVSAGIADLMENHDPFGVLGVVIDNLDQVRLSHGNQAARAVMRVVAQTLYRNLRQADVVGCWSQDGFIALVRNCPAEGLARVAAMLKRVVNTASVPWWGDHISFTVSIGGAVVQTGDTAESLLCRAEAALAITLREGCDHAVIF